MLCDSRDTHGVCTAIIAKHQTLPFPHHVVVELSCEAKLEQQTATMGRGRQISKLLSSQLQQFLGSSTRAGGRAAAGQQAPSHTSVVAKSAQHQATQQQQRAASALAAQATVTATRTLALSQVPAVQTDLYGAISAVTKGQQAEPGVYKNVDGHRFEDGRYKAFVEEITAFIPKERQFSDPVRTFAYGTDASFYRLNPKLVVKVHNEAEVRRIMPIAKRLGVPITFRAAGTSLSGQAITDSVLLKLSHTGKHFRNYEVHVSTCMRLPLRCARSDRLAGQT